MSAQPNNMIARGASLRNNSAVRDLFKAAEGRALSEEELTLYCSLVPDHSHRVEAWRDLARHQDSIVDKTVIYIFSNYPFTKYHSSSEIKCPQDVGLVATYAGHAMLMNDHDWYRDKLLLWLRTMLQSFNFPRRVAADRKTLFGAGSSDKAFDALPQRVQAIRETYTTLRLNFEAVLLPVHAQLLSPYLQQAADVLSAE